MKTDKNYKTPAANASGEASGAEEAAGHHIERMRCPDGTTGKDISENMQYYAGQVTYQKDELFTPISMGNFEAYSILGRDDDFAFALDPQGFTGFVFFNEDIERKPKLGLVPVLRLQLRETSIKGFKQAHRLRIRERFARKNVATCWYLLYVEKFGGIVSDFEHLEGGKQLWKSFVRTANARGLRASLIDTISGKELAVDENTPDSAMWSADATLKACVIVLDKP